MAAADTRTNSSPVGGAPCRVHVLAILPLLLLLAAPAFGATLSPSLEQRIAHLGPSDPFR